MRHAVVLSGTILDDAAVITWLAGVDRLICADGGARHLRRMNLLPDLLIGDMDSISAEDKDWLASHHVPVQQFPAVKDQTDAELAIRSAMTGLPEPHGSHELLVAGAFGSRPDHVLANQLLAASLASQGWRFTLTDGRSWLYTLSAGQSLVLQAKDFPAIPLAVSAIPVTPETTGLTYQGLAYPLKDARLTLGSTLGVSNLISKFPVKISLESGILLVIITPQD
jgi:thiamine pyrophosphokinase